MATFEVDFIFCCPCFVTSLFNLISHNLRKNLEFSHLFIGEIEERCLTLTIFQVNETMFVSYFMHLSDAMDLDSLECLHYNRRVFYRVVLGDGPYAERKCYSCYGKSVRKLLKCFPRFVIS